MSVLGDRAQQLVGYLGRDATSSTLLNGFIAGLLDPAERLSTVAHGDSTVAPWAALTDPSVTPLWALPHAAMWTGGRLPTRLEGETDADYLTRARLELVQPGGMRRGGAASLILAARPHLTGTKTVRIAQQAGSRPWEVAVGVVAAEAPDVAALEAAVNDAAVIVGGMRALVHILEPDFSWNIADLEWVYFGRNIAALEADFPTTIATLESAP